MRFRLVLVLSSIAIAAAPLAARQAPKGAAPSQPAPAAAAVKPLAFAVDKLWPMPLPNHWVYGSITGLAIDSRDHVFVATRPGSVAAGNEAGLMSNPPTAEYCCLAAPPILEFDAAGKLVASWGEPSKDKAYDWPVSTGGIAVDDKGNIWITAAGVPEPAAAAAGATGVVPGAARAGGAAAPAAAAAGRGRGETVIPGAEGAPVAPAGRGNAGPPAPADAHILKFTRDGKFLMQIGKAGATGPRDSKTTLDKPADVFIDNAASELYVADGGANQRVVVFDATTGAFKRQWTGHGGEFQRISSITVSKDGLVYVGDRKGNRVQVFKKDGTFAKELEVAKGTTANGSVWDVGLSNDAKQSWLFVADGQNSTVRVFNRDTLAPAGTIGDGGRWPGRFYAVNNLAMDSKGNLFTGEGYEGKRVQKFVKK